MTNDEFRFDEIGYWSEIKLEILKNYATEYSKILSAQKEPPLRHIYIDASAGAGVHLTRSSGDFVPGSPMNALNVRPPFKESGTMFSFMRVTAIRFCLKKVSQELDMKNIDGGYSSSTLTDFISIGV